MKHLRPVLVSATTVLAAVAEMALIPPSAASVATPRGAHQELQEGLDKIVDTGAVGALAEVRDERGVWRAASGVSRIGTTQPVAVRSRFRAGSITKTFIATVVLQLVDEGRLRLDDPVEKWLPGVVPGGERIMLRHLLNHTSGLYDFLRTLTLPPAPGFLKYQTRTWTADEQIQRALAHPPVFKQPGSQFSYSNTNYLLLGQVIEKVTGHSYGDEVERRIVRPLGLHGTTMPGTSELIQGPHPHGYVLIDDGERRLVDFTKMNPSLFGAAGEIISTTADLNKFFAALFGGRLLPPGLLADMMTPGTPGGRYGLGIFLKTTTCGVPIYGNDGDAAAYQSWSYATRDGRRRVTLAVTPDSRNDLDDVVDDYLDEVFCD